MADDFLTPTIPEERVTDYLGGQAPLTFKGNPALPVTGAAAVGAPQGPVGLAGGLRVVGGGEGSTGQGQAGGGINPLSAAGLLRNVRFADLADTLFGTGPAAGATTTSGGSLTTSAPEILRSGQFPDFPAGAVTDFPGIGIGTGEAVVPTGATASALEGPAGGSIMSDLSALTGLGEGALGSIGGAAAAVPAVVLAALSDEPNWEKAVDSALAVAGGALSPWTFGISGLAAGVADLLVHLFANQQGPYVPKRQAAFGEAKAGLGELAGVYQQAAQTGDPAQVLQALGTGEAGGHIRSELSLPKDVAAELGVTGFPRGNNLQIQWDALTPQQFNALLSKVETSDPSVLNQWIVGSGDVPYLPQATAQSAADAAAGDARSLLEFMAQSRQQAAAQPMGGELTQAPASQTQTTPGGGGEVMAEQELMA